MSSGRDSSKGGKKGARKISGLRRKVTAHQNAWVPQTEEEIRGREKGAANESKALRSLMDPSFSYPPWFLSARPATRKEDIAGVDAIIAIADKDGSGAYVYVGEIAVQIKSSEEGAREFLENHPDWITRVAIVVVREGESEEKVRLKILASVALILEVRMLELYKAHREEMRKKEGAP